MKLKIFYLHTLFHNSFSKIFGIGWKSKRTVMRACNSDKSYNKYYDHQKWSKKRIQRKRKCEKLRIYLINVYCLHVMSSGIWWMKCHGQILLINNKMQHYSYHDYICLEGFFYCDASFILFLKKIVSLIRLLDYYIYSAFFWDEIVIS